MISYGFHKLSCNDSKFDMAISNVHCLQSLFWFFPHTTFLFILCLCCLLKLSVLIFYVVASKKGVACVQNAELEPHSNVVSVLRVNQQ